MWPQSAGWSYHQPQQQWQGAPQPSDPSEWAAKAAEWAKQRQAMAEHARHYEPQFGAHPLPVGVPQHREDPPPLMPPYSGGQLYEPLTKPPYHTSSRTSHLLSGSETDGMEIAAEPLEPHPPPLMGPPPGHLSHPLQQHGPPKKEELLEQQPQPPPTPEEYLRPSPLVRASQHEFYVERIPIEGHPPPLEPYPTRDPAREPPVRGPSVDGFNQPSFVPHDRPDAPYFPPTAPHPPQDPFYVPPGYPVGPPMGTEVPSIPEVKKKMLPAWLREGLEKVARDKQKQQELEERKKVMEVQGREGSRWGDDEDETQGDMEEENVQEHATFGQSNSPLLGPSRPRGILKNAPPSIIQVGAVPVGEKQEEEKEGEEEEGGEEEEEEEEEEESDREVAEKLSEEEMLLKVKKLTIEILMAVTDSEVRSVAEEVMKEVKMPRSSRWDMTQEPTQRNRTAQSRAQQREKDREGPNKILALGAYESDNSGSSEEDEQEGSGELSGVRRQALTNPYPDLPKAGSTEEEAIERAFGSRKEEVDEEKAMVTTLPTEEVTSSKVDSLNDNSSRRTEGKGAVDKERCKLPRERHESVHSPSAEEKVTVRAASSDSSVSSKTRSPDRGEQHSRLRGEESPADFQEGRKKGKGSRQTDSGQQRKKQARSLSSGRSRSRSPGRQLNGRKDRQSHSRGRRSHSRDRQSRLKGRRSRSNDKRSHSRDRQSHSKDRQSRLKGRQSHSKDRRSRSKDRRSRSKDRRSHSMDRQSGSKDRRSHSKDRRSHSKDRRSRSKDRQSRSKDRRSHSKDRQSRSKDRRSRSKDRRSRSKDRRSRSKDRRSRSKDRQSHSKDRQSRSKDRQSHSRDRQSQSKDKQLHLRDKQIRKKRQRSGSNDSSQSGDQQRRARSTSHERLREREQLHPSKEKGRPLPLSSGEHREQRARVFSDLADKGATKEPRSGVAPSNNPLERHTQQARKRAAKSPDRDTPQSLTSESDSGTGSSSDSSSESSSTTSSARKRARHQVTEKKKEARKHRGKDGSSSTSSSSRRKKTKHAPSPLPRSKDKAHGRDKAHTRSRSKSRKKKRHL